eukprot:gene32202-39764_t
MSDNTPPPAFDILDLFPPELFSYSGQSDAVKKAYFENFIFKYKKEDTTSYTSSSYITAVVEQLESDAIRGGLMTSGDSLSVEQIATCSPKDTSEEEEQHDLRFIERNLESSSHPLLNYNNLDSTFQFINSTGGVVLEGDFTKGMCGEATVSKQKGLK